MLRREVVPVIEGARACFFCDPFISNPYYIVSSRHVRGEMIVERCDLESLLIKT